MLNTLRVQIILTGYKDTVALAILQERIQFKLLKILIFTAKYSGACTEK